MFLFFTAEQSGLTQINADEIDFCKSFVERLNQNNGKIAKNDEIFIGTNLGSTG
jgi:hypothetical protein